MLPVKVGSTVTLYIRVAVTFPSITREWRNRQTRTVQVRVLERVWGFNSPLAHHKKKAPISHISEGEGAFLFAGGPVGGLRSADGPSAQCVAVDEGARADGATVATVHPFCPRLTPAAAGDARPVE